MKIRSLSLRLISAASISVLLALLATGLAFGGFFKAYFEDRVQSELATHLQQLTANIEIDADGQFVIYPLSDQRFDQPFSGLYWQIDQLETKPLHSRSLWDLSLIIERPNSRGKQITQRVSSDGSDLMVLSWVVTIGGDENPIELMLSVATDYEQIQATVSKFNKSLLLWLSLLAFALIFAAWLQVRIGLKPLEAIRSEIVNVRAGTVQYLQADVPSEVAPLVAEVNDLLDNQRENLLQARNLAGNLAHGLKTPLTVMRTVTQQMRGEKTEELASQLNEQIQAMAHFVERELARSRMSTKNTASTAILPVVNQMVAAISKLPASRDIEWQVDIPDNLKAPFDAFDLSEMLGNLLDNAREWTHDSVHISAMRSDDHSEIVIADNGPGIAEELLSEVLERGKRIDDSRPGSGLGLAIVQDLTKMRGCTLILRNLPAGGLEIRISWR